MTARAAKVSVFISYSHHKRQEELDRPQEEACFIGGRVLAQFDELDSIAHLAIEKGDEL